MFAKNVTKLNDKYCLLCKKVATELIDYSSVILYKYNKVYEVEEEETRCY